MKKPETQKEKFIKAAKEAGCDESVEAFEEKLKKITKPEKAKESKK